MLNIRKIFQKLLDINTYKICFLIGCFLYTFPMTSIIMSKLFKLYLLWAFIIIGYDIFKGKKYGLAKENYLLLLFIFICFISSLINYQSNLINNITIVLYLFIQTIMMCLYKNSDDENYFFKFIKTISKVIISITFICAILSLLVYFFNIKLSVNNGFQEVLIGVFEGRLWSIYGNPNTLGHFSLLSIIFSGIYYYIKDLLKEDKNKPIKIFLCINIILEWICILLSNSRSTLVSITLSFLIYILFYSANKYRKKNETIISSFKCNFLKNITTLIISAISIIVVSIFLKYSIPMLTVSIRTVSTTFQSLVNNTDVDTPNLKDELNIFNRENNTNDISNGRFSIWSGVLKVTKNHPLFGVGFKNVNEEVNKYLPLELVKEDPKLAENTHNIYLQVLVSHGIFAFIIFIIFFIYLGCKYLIYLFKYKSDKTLYNVILLNSIVILSLLIINLFDSNILYFFSIFIVPIFFISLNNLQRLSKINEKNNKKNILFLIDSLAGGGAEKVLVDLTNNLDYKKYNVEVKTIYNEGVYVNKLNKNITYTSFIKKPNIWLKRIVNRLIKYLPSRVIYQLIVTKNYDVEIAFLEFLSTKVMTGSNSSALKIAWVHVDMFDLKNGTTLYYSKKHLIKSYQIFDKIVCVSDSTREHFCKETKLYQSTITMYNPIDKDNINKLAKEKCPIKKNSKKFTMVSIGRLTYQKNYSLLCEVINKLKDNYPNIELWILGEGEEREKLENYIKENNLEEYIRLLGFRENPYCYLKEADLFVSSSIVEGFSLVLAEAVTLGIPILSTNTSGPNNILDHGKYGMLVECNFNDLYNGLKDIISTPSVLNDLKNKVSKRVDFLDLKSKIDEFDKIVALKDKVDNNSKIFCTVFTPAYNRAHLIPRLYESLKSQTSKNFEWVVVDDGSTDGTDKLFDKYLKDKNDFKITYIKEENGGKHRAINKGLELSLGKLFFIVDSDDYLDVDAIKKLEEYESTIKDLDGFAGVSGLKGYDNTRVVGGYTNKPYIDAYNNERKYYNLLGDKAEAYYTNILRKYKFPEIENEKFVSENVVWNKIANDGYKIRWFNDIIYICDYLDDGLTKQGMKLYYNNPVGYLLFIRNGINYENPNLINRLSNYYGYYMSVKDKLTLKEIADDLLISKYTLILTIYIKKLRDKFKKGL